MGQREMVLDGLAWAGMPEQARVAKLAAKLVRQSGAPNHTQAHVKEVIRNTAPPYGRAKYIFEKVYGKKVKTDDGEIVVGSELNRQYAIFAERRNKHNEWAEWLAFRAEHSTRLNYAYASTFSRPVYELHRSAPPEVFWTWSMGHEHPAKKRMEAWEKQEEERDKGDICIGLTHQGEHTVCLVSVENTHRRPHIAVRRKSGPIVRTYLREDSENLVEAAVSLGGPKVRAALARGKRVKTDWVGRRSFIHHDGSDHIEPKVEEVSWQAARWDRSVETQAWGDRVFVKQVEIVVHGDHEKRA